MGLGGGGVFLCRSAVDEAESAVEEPGAAPPPQPSDARLPTRTAANPASAFFMSCPPPTSGVEHSLVQDGRSGGRRRRREFAGAGVRWVTRPVRTLRLDQQL